jgi:hypothetical protein
MGDLGRGYGGRAEDGAKGEKMTIRSSQRMHLLDADLTVLGRSSSRGSRATRASILSLLLLFDDFKHSPKLETLVRAAGGQDLAIGAQGAVKGSALVRYKALELFQRRITPQIHIRW